MIIHVTTEHQTCEDFPNNVSSVTLTIPNDESASQLALTFFGLMLMLGYMEHSVYDGFCSVVDSYASIYDKETE